MTFQSLLDGLMSQPLWAKGIGGRLYKPYLWIDPSTVKNDISITRWEATEGERDLPGGWGMGQVAHVSTIDLMDTTLKGLLRFFSFCNQNFIMGTILQVKVIKRWLFKKVSYDEIASRLNLKKAAAKSRTVWLLNCFSTHNNLFFSHHL